METPLPYVIAVLTICTITGVNSIRCFQCRIDPPYGESYNSTKKLCTHFDYSDDFMVDCPLSTMCMKQDFHLEIQNGVRIDGVIRDCAVQAHKYHSFKNGAWAPELEILEPYSEGCEDVDDKGQRTTPTRYCYCRKELCNSSPKTSHEGYTDIMGVIVAVNLMKFINGLR